MRSIFNLRRDARPMVGLVLGITLLVLSLISLPPHLRTVPTILTIIATCIAVMLSGMRPLFAATLEGLALSSVWFLPDKTISIASTSMFLIITMTMWMEHRIATLSFTFWYLTVFTIISASGAPSDRDLIQAVFFWLTFSLIFALIGELLLRQREANRSLEERRRTELAEQRRAIARELHDTTVYSTTMMVMRAEAAKLREDTGHEMSTDLDFIARTGRSATADLRTMLDLLRMSDNVNLTSSGSAADRFTIVDKPVNVIFEEQVGKIRDAGIEVKVSVEGDLSALPELIAAAFSRVVTESCSNIVKHAGRQSPATIMAEVGDETVDAIFVNARPKEASSQAKHVDGPKPESPPTGDEDRAGLSFGLIGQRERVEALGGTIEFSQTDQLWIVRVSIPLHR